MLDVEIGTCGLESMASERHLLFSYDLDASGVQLSPVVSVKCDPLSVSTEWILFRRKCLASRRVALSTN